MLILTEAMFVRVMRDETPLSFSEEALKLIYQHYRQDNNSHVEFRTMDVEMAFDEQSYLDCVSDNDIAIELDEATLDAANSDDSENIDLIRSTISDFFNAKGIWVGFTYSGVVYESRR